MKLEVFDPPMCCSTGICGTNVDPKLVIFASDLEWLKKQGIEVIRYGLSFEPAEFVKNEAVKNMLQSKGDKCLPIIVINGEIVSDGCYPTRNKLAEICGIDYNEQEAPPIHREENCCCGIDCDCNTKTVEAECGCGPDCDCHKSDISNDTKKIIFIIIVLIMAGIIAVKFCSKANAVTTKKNTQTIAAEKFADTINSLNQINIKQDVAFVYIPQKNNEKISHQTKEAILSTQNTLNSKKISTSLYILSPKSIEYSHLSSQTTPPAILTIYRGKGKNYVSGKINQTRLLQSYMAALKAGDCGAGCPCHRK